MKLACSTLHISQPVAIRHGPIGYASGHRQQIIEHFLKQKEQSETYGQPGQGWRTHNQIHTENDILNPLLDLIHCWYCNNVVGPRGPKFVTDWNWSNTNNLVIDAEVWFQELEPGQGCPKHEHGTLSRYSWVYYLDVSNGASPLTFTELQEHKGEMNEVDILHLPVYNDMIVMFPSMLLHEVYPVQNKRYILAGNINDITYKESE